MRTQGPWTTQGREIISPKALIATSYGDNAEANAAFVVRACNCHDELLTVAKDSLAVLKELCSDVETSPTGNWVIDNLEAAIKSAEGRAES